MCTSRLKSSPYTRPDFGDGARLARLVLSTQPRKMAPSTFNQLFSGSHVSRPSINLGGSRGSSSEQQAGDLIERARREREAREDQRKRERAAVKLQVSIEYRIACLTPSVRCFTVDRLRRSPCAGLRPRSSCSISYSQSAKGTV